MVSNTATATGQAPGGAPVVSAPSTADTPVAQFAALSAQKHAVVNDLNHDGKTDLGDTITWSVTVTDTGTVPVSSVVIDDPTGGPMTCAATTLAPGASTTCTATLPYTISQPDVDAGRVDNTATATATDPQGAPVTSAADVGHDPRRRRLHARRWSSRRPSSTPTATACPVWATRSAGPST